MSLSVAFVGTLLLSRSSRAADEEERGRESVMNVELPSRCTLRDCVCAALNKPDSFPPTEGQGVTKSRDIKECEGEKSNEGLQEQCDLGGEAGDRGN